MRTIGTIARFSITDKRLLHWLEADKISDAQSKAIRHTTLITLISDIPTVANVLTTDVVLAALIVLLTVLNIEDNIFPPASN